VHPTESAGGLGISPFAFCAGHEMGHVVDFRHNFTPDSANSIMYQYIRSYTNPQNQYQQADFDSFLVKPTQ
jgi:hypothetical protein